MSMTTNLLNDVRDETKDRLEVLFTHFATGDDDTTPTPSDTALGNETFRDAIDTFDKVATGSVTASGVVEASENNGNDVDEIGWFNAGTGGTLWLRNLVNNLTKTSDVILYIDSKINITVEEI